MQNLPRLGQIDRTDPMPAMKRSRNASIPKRGARSGATASGTQVQPEDPETLEGFIINNKNHLS